MFFLLREFSAIPVIGLFFSYFYRIYNLLYGASIPLEVDIPKSTRFPHGIHGIFISKNAIIGERITIYHQVTIGSNQTKGHKMFGAPKIGDDCLIGVGAKIIGNIIVGNNTNLGSNVSVARDVPNNTTVVIGEHHFITR
ncbi:serine acetyltransferase [Aliivibrio fischeri]|uniref:serine acetyltransferase n=1 Tax=Aliivibrio fischeri TaxID=668 RepID=UPI00107E8A3C|nr:serine acetyltransferase [Aliivibrio fischeri]TGA73345.1 serine acetyltransferase [Aliivibrio fischeri]